MLYSSYTLTIFWVTITEPDYYPFFLISSIIVYGGLSYYYWRNKKARLNITLAITTVAITLLTIDILDYAYLGISLLLIGCASLYVGFKSDSLIQKLLGTIVYIMAIFTIVIIGLDTILSKETIAWMLMFLVVFFIKSLLSEHNETLNKSINVKALLLTLFVIHGLFMLQFLTHIGTAVTVSFNESMTSLAISFLWTLFAICLVIYGVIKEQKQVRLFGIGLVFFTLVKVIFADLPYVSIQIKAVLFLGLGASGILLSRLFYSEKKN